MDVSSPRAGMGSATARSNRLASVAATRATATARAAAAPQRVLSSSRRWKLMLPPPTSTPAMPTRRSSIVASASGADSEGFSPSSPEQTFEDRRRSSGSRAVAIPWFYLTPARTFLAAASLKLISFTMATTFFATAVLPFGFWQSALAVAGGVGLALVAKKLEADKFVEKASTVQWLGLVSSAVLAAALFAKLVPGRSNASIMGALDVSPRSLRTLSGNRESSSSSSSLSNPSSLPPAPVRSPPSEGAASPRPRLRTREEADEIFAELKKIAGDGGRGGRGAKR